MVTEHVSQKLIVFVATSCRVTKVTSIWGTHRNQGLGGRQRSMEEERDMASNPGNLFLSIHPMSDYH